MYNVSFPKLGISTKINPVAVTIGNINIYWYGILIALGILLAIMYTSNRARDFKINQSKYLNAIYISIISAIIFSRLYYVIFYPGNYYKNNPSKIFNIFEGGLAVYGGIIGGIISGIIMCKINKINVKATLNLSALGLLIGQTIGRWGNFINQEAFGTTTELAWGVMSEKTNYKTVHPCFLYESIWCFMGFIILHLYSKNHGKKDLNIFLMYTSWYSFGRLLIEEIRTDSLMFLNFKVSQILSLILLVFSLVALLIRNIPRKK
jgi:phosphatidylglycerol:prolipoprotein diacylglycerol transferase